MFPRSLLLSLLFLLFFVFIIHTSSTVNSQSSCSPDYWGSTCTELCMCRQPLSTTTNVSLWPLRGTCDKFSGVCTCYADATQGYWDGATCSDCLFGYIGSSCRLQSIALSQFSPIHYTGDLIVFSKMIDTSTTTPAPGTSTSTTVTTTSTSTTTSATLPPTSTSTTASSSTPSPTSAPPSPPTAPTSQSTAAQPLHWFPHAVNTLTFTVLTGSALAIIDQTTPDSAPLTLDLAETFVGGCTTRLFASWFSPRNGRLFLAVTPSMCNPNEILLLSTLEPNTLRLNIGTQRPNTVKNSLLQYEGWLSVNQTYEEIASTHHGCWVDAWLQFCSVLYRWNSSYRNPTTDSPWNVRCIPVAHRSGSQLSVFTNPMLTTPSKFFQTNAADRIVADVWLDSSLQDLRGIIYWNALDALFAFGSKMTSEQQIMSTQGSASSNYKTETDNFYHTVHGVNSSACFLSIMWRNLSVSVIELPGPDYLRKSCIVIENVVFVNGAILLVNAIFESVSGTLVLDVNPQVSPLPRFFDFAETSVPTDYIATATAYGARGVAVVSHCNRNAFQLYRSSVTADSGGGTSQQQQQQTTTTATSTTTTTSTSTSSSATTVSSMTSVSTTTPTTTSTSTTTTVSPTSTSSSTTTTTSAPTPSPSSTATNTSIQVPPAACLLTRFNFNTRDRLQLVVTQVATDSDLPITSLGFATDQNAILASVSRSPTGLLVRRYLGWAILKAVPALAEVQGGTPVTIYGSGFTNAFQSTATSGGNPLLCAFQPQGTSLSPTFVYNNQLAKSNKNLSATGVVTVTSGDTVFVPATFLSDRAVLCPAAAVTRTSATCSNVDTVDVTVFGTLFTGLGTPVFRFSQPTITSTVPSSVYANGISTLPVTVIGNGFSTSEVIKCKFNSNISGEIITDGSFLSASAILCKSPSRIIPLSPDSTIDIANDGFHYTLRPITFRMFGKPSGLQFTTPSVMATDRTNYDLPSLTVISVDAAGNPTSEGLGILPVLIKSLSRLCTVLNPCADNTDALLIANGTNTQPETKLGGTTGSPMIAGSASFLNLELTVKTATGYNGTVPNYLLLVAYIGANGWFATTKLYVDTGVPVALVIIRAPATVVSDQGDMAATPAVSAIDSGNNIVVNGVESYECQADVLQDPIPAGLELITVDEQVNRPRFAIFSNGLAEFLQIPVHARHGLMYRIRFTIRGVSTIQSVTSGPIHSYCPPGSYKLPGLYPCQSCIAQAICDGDNVSVLPGYWRSSVLSTTVAECPTPAACPGGPVPGECAPHYKGPRCDLCDSEFGRGVTGECDTCPSPALSGFFMLVIVIGLTTVLTFFIVYTVQNSDRPMPRVVVLQQLVTHVQTLAILASLDNPWPQYFMKISQWIDAVVDFRIMDTSFGECLISNYGLDFTAKFFFQIVLLGEIFLCIATTKAVLFIRPHFLKSDGATGNDLLAKGMRRVPLKITTLRIIVPSILCGLFFLHQGTLMYAFGVLDCIDIDLGNGQSESVLLVDPSIGCASAAYKSIAFIAYPIIVILGLLVPIGLVLAYEIHRFFRIEERNLRYQLGAFLLSGVTNSSWYWPVFLFVRKGIMVLIVTLLKWPFDAFFLQTAFIVYLVLLKYIRPYFDKHFLLIDQFGCVINILVINIATMYHTTRSEQWHNAIAPIVICLEMIATVAFSLLISNRWRKWVFVVLRIEKKELPVETEANYLQLHEIMRDHDIAEGVVDREAGSYFNFEAFVPGGGSGGILQEMMPVQKIEGGGVDDKRRVVPRFQGDEEDDVDDDDQYDENGERKVRSVYDLPEKRSVSANALRRRITENTRQDNNNNSNFPTNEPKLFSAKKSLSATHNPILTSRGIVETNALEEFERTQKQNDRSGHQLMKDKNNNNNNNVSARTSSPPKRKRGLSEKAQEYVPRGVPLPDATDLTDYEKQIHQAKKNQYKEAEKKRRELEEENKKARQDISNGPKVVRTSQSLPERSQAFGFDQYRQELSEQAQHRAQSEDEGEDFNYDEDDDRGYYYSEGAAVGTGTRKRKYTDHYDSDEELIKRRVLRSDDAGDSKNSLQQSKRAMANSPPKRRSGSPTKGGGRWKGRFDELDTSHI